MNGALAPALYSAAPAMKPPSLDVPKEKESVETIKNEIQQIHDTHAVDKKELADFKVENFESPDVHYTSVNEDPSAFRNPGGNERDELMLKLDKILFLLEEQRDQKTGHVTEEVVLYSFIGIFIIFVIDSFARAGKYVR
jgi:hypothetical protein